MSSARIEARRAKSGVEILGEGQPAPVEVKFGAYLPYNIASRGNKLIAIFVRIG